MTSANVEAGTEQRKLNRRDLMKVFWRYSTTFQACENFEREQSFDFLYTILPVLRKLYPDKKQLSERMVAHNSGYFNSNPVMMGPIVGLTVAMEEQGADEDAIQALKVGLMGPLAGIGDSLLLVLYATIVYSIGAQFAQQGSIAGPLMVIPLIFIPFWSIRYWSMMAGYSQGVRAVEQLKGSLAQITEMATIVGLTVIGGMAASVVSASTPLKIAIDKTSIQVQQILDQILPSLLPVAVVALAYYLLQGRKWKPTSVLLVLFVLGLGLHLIKFL
ncbi:MAG: PTS system mannose/fructose/sorbose family transporter subunit IID [Bacillota bacterium]